MSGMDNRKIFYKSEAAASKAEARSGFAYVPVTVFEWGETEIPGRDAARSTRFVEKKFLDSLFVSPRSLVSDQVGNTKVSLVHPSPWANLPLVAIEREDHSPDIRIHVSSPKVSGIEMARWDFGQIVEDLRKEQGAIEEAEDEEAATPGL